MGDETDIPGGGDWRLDEGGIEREVCVEDADAIGTQ
jgi:hypothetical protein